MNGSFVGLGLPGYETGQEVQVETGAGGMEKAPAYKIPPVVWMVVFLVVGYLGVRMLIED